MEQQQSSYRSSFCLRSLTDDYIDRYDCQYRDVSDVLLLRPYEPVMN